MLVTEKKRPGFFYGYIIVAAAFVIMAIAVGGQGAFSVFFESILKEFGWTRAVTSGAFSLSVTLSGFLGMLTGRLSDRFGPRLLITISSFFLGLAFFLTSRMSTLWQLYLFFGVMFSLGTSATLVPLVSTTSRWFVKRRGLMTGVVMAGIGAGTIIMPPFIGWLLTNYGWRQAFVILGIVSFTLTIIMAQLLRRDPQSKGLLPDGATEAISENSRWKAGGLSFPEAIRTKELWVLWVIFICQGFVVFSIGLHIVIHATGLGIPVSSAITILTVAGGLNIAGRLVMGNANDRIGGRKVLVIGQSLMLVSLVWLLFARELWMLYLFAVVFGFAWGGSFVPAAPIVAQLFGMKSHGVVFGSVQAGFTIGGTMGPVLTGYVFDVTKSYQIAFISSAAVTLVGLLLALFFDVITGRAKTRKLSAHNAPGR